MGESPWRTVADVERLNQLDALAILDTPPERTFDDIVSVAGIVCDTSIALISLVAGDRQWFKARQGLALAETSLDRSVCVYALGEPSILIIPDLISDARTNANPMTREAPFIRFYAGVPLRLGDVAPVGTLCVIDSKPRPNGLTVIQAGALQALARQVVALLYVRLFLADQARDRWPPAQDNLDEMADALMKAHRCAEEENDGRAMSLIKNSLRHVGMQIARKHALRPSAN